MAGSHQPIVWWSKNYFDRFNPKSTGLFGHSDNWGKRPLTSPHFHSRPTNSISYESWHILLKFDTLLRLLRLKLRPREVAEVAKVQTKKNRSKILKSAIFELQKRYTPQKKAEKNRHLDLKQNQRLLHCTEKIEKKSNSPFLIPKNQNVMSVSAKFWENLSRQ